MADSLQHPSEGPSTPASTPASTLTPAQDDNSHTFSRDAGGRGLRRMVTWADGTAAPQEVNIAISIPRHKKLKAGYHVFSIEVWQEGRAWQVRRRYKQFAAFHAELLEEALLPPERLPPLPPKNIFHMRHFSKRAEDKFLRERRVLLQEYVRQMVKTEEILERSFALQSFLEINKTRLNSGMKPTKSRQQRHDELDHLRHTTY